MKHYRTHLGPILALGVSHDGKSLASIGADQGGKTVQELPVKGSAKVFDVENFGEWDKERLAFSRTGVGLSLGGWRWRGPA